MKSKQSIIGFYKPMFSKVREHLTVNSINTTNDSITLDAVTRFTTIEDAPSLVVGALEKGEYIEGRVIVKYRLREGLICHIGVERGGVMTKYGAENVLSA